MHLWDWVVMVATLAFVIFYGVWKSRDVRRGTDFLAGKRELKWWTIGLSIMATQASAITFLSTPGQGFADGLQFVQFYFGMPVAMIILSVFVLPIYYRLRITTAYEYLEQRFDLRMRTVTAILFLAQRGVAAAISIYAPSIILCVVFGWNLAFTNFLMAIFVIFYTTSGGSAAVSRTQELQMSIMLGGLVLAFFYILYSLPEGVGLSEAWQTAGLSGKTDFIDYGFKTDPETGDTKFDWSNRYNLFSGFIGATFLFLSYFGTDQSQVGRYLSGKSLKESRFGLLFNGFVKVPMQFLVLSVGVMAYVYYQYNAAPLHYNPVNRAKVAESPREAEFRDLERRADSLFLLKSDILQDYALALREGDTQRENMRAQEARALELAYRQTREAATQIVKEVNPSGKNSVDKDFVFIRFILEKMPIGIIGLMLAVVFCGAWSTTASELNALTATVVSDIYRRSFVPNRDETHYLRVSRIVTVLWGLFIMLVATYADLFDNLIQAVNMIGSVFYGTILGIFFTAFFLRKVQGVSVFWAAVITQILIFYLFFGVSKDPYLWYNPLGCGLVMGLSWLIQTIQTRRQASTASR